jgi:hypothetical protein
MKRVPVRSELAVSSNRAPKSASVVFADWLAR